MYRKFKPLNIPDGWEQYWSKYPNGYTIMEALIDWVSQVDDMVENQNELTDTVKSFGERIDEFINQFGAELQKEVQDLLTEWQNSGFLNIVINEALQWQLDDYIATNEQDKLVVSEQLEHEAISPQEFSGTDTEKLQQAINKAIQTKKAVNVSDFYEIDDTLIINVGSGVRGNPLHFIGGGTIKRTTSGPIFKGAHKNTSDIYFSNIKFHGDVGIDVTVFDCSDAFLIRTFTTNCYFYRVKDVYYSNIYLQTVRSTHDTFIQIYGSVFNVAGGLDVTVIAPLQETSTGNFITHTPSGEFPYLYSWSIIDACLEGFKSSDKAVFEIGRAQSFKVTGGYFEELPGGLVNMAADGVFHNVLFENMYHSGDNDVGTLIKWGGTLVNCQTKNNFSRANSINDTTNVTVGNLLSDNDESILVQSSLDPKNVITFVEDELISKFPSTTNYQNLLRNTLFETTTDWNPIGTDTSLQIMLAGGYRTPKYLRLTSVEANGCIRQSIPTNLNANEYYMIYIVSRSNNLEPFNVNIMNQDTGEVLRRTTFYPRKINVWEEFARYAVPHTTASNGNIVVSIHPKESGKSENSYRDFDSVAIYKVHRTDLTTQNFLNHVGFSIRKAGGQLNKLDANGDGIADIPYSSTATRPIGLSDKHIGLTLFDTTKNILVVWNGTQWRNAGTGVED